MSLMKTHQADVAQTGSLPYRRLATCGVRQFNRRLAMSAPSRLPVGDTADRLSALQH
jgi:hypothetical protein